MTRTRETRIMAIAALSSLLEALERKAQAGELTEEERAQARRLLERLPEPDPLQILSSWPPWASEEELSALESFEGGEFLASQLRGVAGEFRGTDVWELLLTLGARLDSARAALG